MKHLHENDIKRVGIAFLKSYYKYRPRTGKATTATDQETAEGIISDGMISFITDNGEQFSASLEATSYDTKDEVLYTNQVTLLNWDSFVWAAFGAVVFFSLSHHYGWVTVNKNGWMFIIGLLIAILGALHWIMYKILSSRPRYRYIYAVEQFKKYHADEQWIAIADDVFDSSVNPNLVELKNQCVNNGFGLLSVNKDEEARILITPSRQEVFGMSRSKKQFNHRDEYTRTSGTERVRNFWNRLVTKITGKQADRSVSRYQRTFTSQILMSLIAVGIIGGIFYKEAQEAPIAYVNEKDYERKLQKKAKELKGDSDLYIVDSAFVDPHNPNAKPYLEELASNDFEDDRELDWDVEIAKYFEDSGEQYAEIYIASGASGFVSYDCERFFSYTGTKYLIQEGTYETVREARKQLIRLRKRGINAHCLWTGCFEDIDMEFIVFVDFLFDEKRQAGIISKNMQRRFQMEKGSLKIRSITL